MGSQVKVLSAQLLLSRMSGGVEMTLENDGLRSASTEPGLKYIRRFQSAVLGHPSLLG